MMHASRRAAASVQRLSNNAVYEQLKQKTPKAVIGFYSGSWSHAGKSLAPQFETMAKSYDDKNFAFFSCDVDEVPTAAYDAECVDVPAVAVMPVGCKPCGTPYGKEDWYTAHADETLNYSQILSDAKNHLDKLQFAEQSAADLQNRKPWRFDPNTGTTLPPVPDLPH